jgi:hypothetical protein
MLVERVFTTSETGFGVGPGVGFGVGLGVAPAVGFGVGVGSPA